MIISVTSEKKCNTKSCKVLIISNELDFLRNHDLRQMPINSALQEAAVLHSFKKSNT